MDKIFEFIVDFWNKITEFAGYVLDGFVSVGLAIVQVVLDGFLSFVYMSISALDVGSLVFNSAAAWGGLDSKIVWMVNAIGLPTCMTILGGAYVLRFVMNLIPAALTRV